MEYGRRDPGHGSGVGAVVDPLDHHIRADIDRGTLRARQVREVPDDFSADRLGPSRLAHEGQFRRECRCMGRGLVVRATRNYRDG